MSDARSHDRPVVLLRPAPQLTSRIFAPDALRRLHERYHVVDLEADPSEAAIDAALPDAWAIIGHPDLPAERLARAPNLRVDHERRGQLPPERRLRGGVRGAGSTSSRARRSTRRRSPSTASVSRSTWPAASVARIGAFREGRERWVSAGNADAILLRGADVGILGYGNIGRALLPLLEPFRPTVRAYDPWLPDAVIREAGMEPAPLDEVLARSTFLFILATVTDESTHLLNARNLELIPPGARVVLASRAAVVDFEPLLRLVAEGRFLCAIDVWPEEPLAADHPARAIEGLVLSAHRAGGIPEAFERIGEMVLDDLALIERGLPPVRMQRAARELVGRYRSRPVT